MDNRTIFSKTGKGSLEISKKSIKLAAEERQALILVDGRSTLAELEEKLNKIAPPRMRAIFEKLLELDLIRIFVTKGGPDSISPLSGANTTGIGVQEITEDDLDFTAFAPVAASNTLKDIEDRRRAAAEAESKAAEEAAVREKARQAEVARLTGEKAEKEAKALAEARERARLEEEAKRRALAEAQTRAAAELKVREESARKAREEAERTARVAAELKAREESERKAREEAERKARAAADRKSVV